MKYSNSVLFIALFFTFLLNACQNDTGLPPDTNLIDAISKTWKCAESGAGSRNYDVVIAKNTAVSGQIFAYNFHNLGSNNKITAILSGTKITFSTQTINGYTFAGGATVSADGTRIDWNYTVVDNYGTVNISATYTPGSLIKKSQDLTINK